MSKRKRIKKVRQKKIKLKEIEIDNNIINYFVYSSVPEKLQPNNELVGKIFQVAGKKLNDLFKLQNVYENHVMMMDESGAARAFKKESVALHTDENKRDADLSLAFLIAKAASKKRGKRRK